MSSREDIPEDDELLAAEHALRLLEGEAQLRAEARMRDDPAFRRAVFWWEARLAELEAEAPGEQLPPAALRARLLAHVAGRARGGSRWRFGWPAGALVAGVLALGVVSPVLNPQGFDPVLHADLMENGVLELQAGYDARTGRLRLIHEALQMRPDRARELWLLPADGSAPISVGLVPDTPDTMIRLPRALVGELAGGKLAVSDEPPGGSPTGQPTGAILAIGSFYKV